MQMQLRQGNALRGKRRRQRIKPADLFACERNIARRETVGAAEMRIYPVHREIFHAKHRARRLRRVPRDAEAVHPGVDLQMYAQRHALRIQRFGVRKVGHGLRKAETGKLPGALRRCAAENEYV